MTCETTRELLLAYLDEELTQAERAAVDGHLGGCSACRAELEETAATRRVVGGLVAAGALGADFARRTAESAECQGALSAAPTPPWGRLAVAAAVVAVFVGHGLFVLLPPDRTVRVPDQVRPLGIDVKVGGGVSSAPRSAGGVTRPESSAEIAPAADPRLETRVFTQQEFHAGARASVRVLVRDWKHETPVAGASVEVRLKATGANGQGTVDALLFGGVTDAHGTVPASFVLPDLPAGEYRLHVETRLGKKVTEIDHPIRVRRDCALVLTTDKPSYQPGQVIHVRAMALRIPSHLPVADVPLTIEIEDPQGNRIHRARETASSHGLADTRLELAHEIRLGAYVIVAKADVDGKAIEERKAVAVDRYSLPKFKIAAKLDRDAYRPGDRIQGTVQADYFFGKPVADAEVEAVVEWGEAPGKPFFRGTARTDAGGACLLPEVPLPNDRKAGTAVLVLTLRDPGQQTEKTRLTAPVATGDITVTAFVEGGEVVPGLANRLWVVAQYSDGKPAEAEVTMTLAGAERTVRTDALGVADLEWTDDFEADGTRHKLVLAAHDARGNRGEGEAVLPRRDPGPALRVALDRAAYAAGDPLQVRVDSVDGRGPVYVDVLRNGQVVLTRSLELLEGVGTLDVALPPDVSGVVEVMAYGVARRFHRVSDARRAYVAGSDDLAIEIALDRETYRPGEAATLDVRVRDREGKPAPAALGLWVVDPAVLARADFAEGLDRILFRLEREVLEPRHRIPGVDQETAFFEDDAARRDRAAKALFAACETVERLPGRASSRDADVTAEMRADAAELAAAARRWLGEERARLRADEMTADWQRLERARREGKFVSYAERLRRSERAIWSAVQKYWTLGRAKLDEPLQGLVDAGVVDAKALLDPWGTRYRNDASFCSCSPGAFPHELKLTSAGPDRRFATPDDVQIERSKVSSQSPLPNLDLEDLAQDAGVSPSVLRDPWRRRYEVEGLDGNRPLLLFSSGPDRERGTDDDVVCTADGAWARCLSAVPAAWLEADAACPASARVDPFDGKYVVRAAISGGGVVLSIQSPGADGRLDTDDDLATVLGGGEGQPVASVGSLNTRLVTGKLFPWDEGGPAALRWIDPDDEPARAWVEYGDAFARPAGNSGALLVARDGRAWQELSFAYVSGDDGEWGGDGGPDSNQDFVSYEDNDATMILAENRFGLDLDADYWKIEGDPGIVVRLGRHPEQGINIDYDVDEKSLRRFIYEGIYDSDKTVRTDSVGLGIDYYLTPEFENVGLELYGQWGDRESRFAVGGGDDGDVASAFIDLPRPGPRSDPRPSRALRPRVRSHFPETLYVAPQVLTDAEGRARITVRLADTITRWEAAAIANTRDGRLGSTHRAIEVFQDFFLDVGVPPYLTQNDLLEVPVSVMNYLREAQDVRVALAPADWYEPVGDREATLRIEAGKVGGVRFRIRARGVGFRRLRVDAYQADRLADAMERTLEILPDGREEVFHASRILEGRQSFRYVVPANAVDGGSSLVVRLHPGCFAQVVEGMDSMLHMPCG